jgi:DNA repair exonuclease SbcCD nuclease subunit
MITDLHIGVRNDSPIFHEYFKKCFDWFFNYLDEHNIKDCIVLGDLVDRRKYINILTARHLREDFLEQLEKRGIKSHVIPGNHDCYWKNTNEVNALDELIGNRYSHIKLYQNPTTINIDGLDIFLLPWITKDNEAESMEEIKNTTAHVCMGHLELEGFEFYKGQMSDHGTTDKRVFDKFWNVYSGHYHHRSTRDNITYLGAFSEHIWSDYNDPRGFTILDTETHDTVFHRNPHRIFHMVAYDDVKNTDILEKINATDYSKYKDCYVKVVCVNKSNPFAFDMLLDKLYKESPADISIVEDVNLFTDTAADDVIDQAQDTVTILDNYITNLTLPVDNDKMKTYMRDVYLEAVTLENVE